MKNIGGKTDNSLQIRVFVIPLQKNMDYHIYEYTVPCPRG